MHLDVNLGVKYLLAKCTAIQVVSMNVHQMFLQLIWFGEEFHAASAAVLCCKAQVVQRQVGLQLFLAAQLLPTLFAGKLGQC